MKRRDFVKNSIAVAASAPLIGNIDLQASKKNNIGIQIYTIRDILQKDATGGIKAIAAAGYKNVELAGYNDGKFYGLPAKELKNLTDGLGMKVLSSHVMVDPVGFFKENKLSDEYLKALDDAVFLGQKFIVWPFIMPPFRNDLDNAKRFAALFNAAGAEAKKRGLRFGYHNHNFEFAPIGDSKTNMFDIFMKETDPVLVSYELDLYWVVFANVDPIAFIKQNPGRFSLYHVKDLAKTDKRESIEIGDGTIDFNKIFKEGKVSGAQYYIVEQEAYRTTSLDAIKTNFKRISKLKLV
ncbi:MAG: sugar phosphate isomerase/epimerase [Saprospiraceae bacterium]